MAKACFDQLEFISHLPTISLPIAGPRRTLPRKPGRRGILSSNRCLLNPHNRLEHAAPIKDYPYPRSAVNVEEDENRQPVYLDC